jgi:uncharacterized membrane protein
MESYDIFSHLLIGPLSLLISAFYYLFPPKKINLLYGHRTRLSMKNQEVWAVANKMSSVMIIWVSVITCLVQIGTIFLQLESDDVILISTVVLVIALVIGSIRTERKLKKLFDKEGIRR